MVTPATDENGLRPAELQEGSGDLAVGVVAEAATANQGESQEQALETVSVPSDTSGATGGKPPSQEAPDVVTQLRTENARLTQAVVQYQAETFQQKIEQAARGYSQYLNEYYVEQGYDEKVAQSLAVSEARAQVAQYVAEEVIRKASALEPSHEKADPQAQRIAALEKQVAQLTKARVPAQQYDQGGGLKGGSSYRERLRSGGDLPSAEEIDRMTAAYLR